MAPSAFIGPIRWNTIIEYALPIPALALLAGLLLEGPSGQTSPYDSFMYPLVAAALLIVDWLLIRKHISIGVATMLAASGGSFFFASKLGYLLFFYPNAQLIPNEMTESLFWVPTVYILAAFVPGTPGARQIPLSFFGVFTLTSLTYLVTTWGQLNYPVLYALLQLNLANLTSAVLVISFNALRVDYERTEAKAEVLKLRAATDSLTGLANRHHFEHVLEQALEEAAQHGERLAVAFIDLDSFKAVNDSLGHNAGDDLLCKVGCVLTQHVRDGDLVARLGGDEFVLLLRRLNDTQTGLRMVERLSELLGQPFELEGRWQRTSASIGVSFFPDDGCEDLLRRADSAMYEAKRQKRCASLRAALSPPAHGAAAVGSRPARRARARRALSRLPTHRRLDDRPYEQRRGAAPLGTSRARHGVPCGLCAARRGARPDFAAGYLGARARL